MLSEGVASSACMTLDHVNEELRLWFDKTGLESFLRSVSHMLFHLVITSCTTKIIDREPAFIQKKMTGRVSPEIRWF